MASAQVVETSVDTNNSPSQDYTTNPDDHSNHNIDSPSTWVQTFHCYTLNLCHKLTKVWRIMLSKLSTGISGEVVGHELTNTCKENLTSNSYNYLPLLELRAR